jgi:cardiolipin synthase C
VRHGLLVILAAPVLLGCAWLPRQVARPTSTALVDTEQTLLGRLIAPAASSHATESGFLLFNRGEGAIAARVALADVAQSSIDAQYFEWAGDEIGRVLLDRVLAAADRGVRVRLLIDDYNSEVRVFNPFVRGRLRLPQLISRFTS